jgi:hypothetical protein
MVEIELQRVRDGEAWRESWWAGGRTLLFSRQAKKELQDDVEVINGATPNAGSLRNPMWKFV